MTRMKPFTSALAAASITAASIFAGPAMAQQSSVAEAELDAFVVAFKEVVAIEQTFVERLEQTTDEAEQQSIISEAQAEMTAAVEEAPNMDVDRYVEIIELAQADPELQAELNERLQE